MSQTILVVEDDDRIADVITKNLEAAGYGCHRSVDGGRALADFERLRPALVVLDLGLAGVDGLEVTRRLRRSSPVPILMVTARASEADKLLGLEIGADDYVTKPFSPAELVARVRALLRRSTGAILDQVVETRGLRIDPARRTVECQGKPVALTSLEFDLLAALAREPGVVVRRAELLTRLWGDEYLDDSHLVDVHIANLRRKLGDDATEPRFIETLRGVGYRLREAP